MSQGYQLIGDAVKSDVLIVVDHASNHIPKDVKLDLDASLAKDHIAWDIGVAEITKILCEEHNHAAILAIYSRLVVDLNRYPDEDGVMPPVSDNIEIKENITTKEEKQRRLTQYYHPYHNKLAAMMLEHRPKLMLSLHSFSPILRSDPKLVRPWDVGVMYNDNGHGSKLALEYLSTKDFTAGDQKPYSGKLLNATMNQHAEANNIDYIGMEIRQDHLGDEQSIQKWANMLQDMLSYVLPRL